ncbi:MAG: YMGG-like glycine zipper-containing protein [Woeseiaceae bacterium]
MLMRQIACICVLLGFSTAALAQDLFVYPKNNQDAAQQQKDESECYVWGKNQTGFDPMAVPTASEPAPQVDSRGADGTMVRGAARGAALGAIVGNSDDAAKGAAAGAAIGAMRRRDRQRTQQKDRDNWEQEQAARYAEQRNNYNRAFKGCMEARDYSVS